MTWKGKWAWQVCDVFIETTRRLLKEKIVGHILLYLFPFFFLQLLQSKFLCMVIGKQVSRGAGFKLEIHIKYRLCGHAKALSRIQEKKTKNKRTIWITWKKKNAENNTLHFCPCPLIRRKLETKRSFCVKCFIH